MKKTSKKTLSTLTLADGKSSNLKKTRTTSNRPKNKIMKKDEAKANTQLNQYLRETRFHCYYELKQTTGGNSMALSKIEKVQWEGLQAMENEGLVWKLSDEDQRQKPCDGFCAPPLPAYLIIKFPDAFYFIRFKEVMRMKEEGQFGISRETAKVVAEKIIRIDNKKKNEIEKQTRRFSPIKPPNS